MNEARKVVKEINDKLFMDSTEKLIEHDYFTYLEYVETPIGDYIKYLGQYIWDSENDYREWLDEDNQEPLEKYLIREMDKIFEVVKAQMKVLCKKRKAIDKIYESRPNKEELVQRMLAKPDYE